MSNLKQQIKAKEEDRDQLLKEVREFEIDPGTDEVELLYREFLNEEFGEVKIGNLTFEPAEVLEKLDPSAYRVGLNNFVGEHVEKEDLSEYQNLVDKLEEAESELMILRSDL